MRTMTSMSFLDIGNSLGMISSSEPKCFLHAVATGLLAYYSLFEFS